MQRIALVTADLEPLGVADPDLPLIAPALLAAGLDVQVCRWDDPAVDWSRFDAVVMRSPWDYSDRVPEFLPWLGRVEQQSTVLNPPDLLRWNLDKSYLLDLAGRGVPIVPTAICDTVDEVATALRAVGSDRAVIKPNVSVGSHDTGLFASDSDAGVALAAHILGVGKRVLVEPAVPSVATEGEHALLFFGGAFSHAARKGPILADGGGLLGGNYRESITTITPDPAELDVARTAVAAIRAHAVEHGFRHADLPPLYARLDLVRLADGTFALLEAELFEPSYFLATSPGSVQRFTAALLATVEGAPPLIR